MCRIFILCRHGSDYLSSSPSDLRLPVAAVARNHAWGANPACKYSGVTPVPSFVLPGFVASSAQASWFEASAGMST